MCEFLGFCCGVAEMYILLGYEAMSLDTWFMMFSDGTCLSSSKANLFNRKVPCSSRSDDVFQGVYRDIF
jgi:hypothetical protein